jgi:hypothetical protein
LPGMPAELCIENMLFKLCELSIGVYRGYSMQSTLSNLEIAVAVCRLG